MNQSIVSTLSNDTMNRSELSMPSQETLSQSIDQLTPLEPGLNLDFADQPNQANTLPQSLTIPKDGKFFNFVH